MRAAGMAWQAAVQQTHGKGCDGDLIADAMMQNRDEEEGARRHGMRSHIRRQTA